MAYSKQTWVNGPGGGTPLDADRMNHIEDGIEEASSGVGGGAVSSVAGKTGVVTLAKGDVGLGNVDNTSDANKPVSTAQAIALAGKADDNAVVKLTGAQTVAGVKTFSSPPVVPDAAFPLGKVTGLSDALTARVRVDTATQGLTDTQKGNARTNIGALDSAITPSLPIVVIYNGTAWPTYDTDPARVRDFRSQAYPSAAAPMAYNSADSWLRSPEAV